MKILVLHGPNLNLLGTREPNIYGSETLEDIVGLLKEKAAELGANIDSHQTNCEGDLVSAIGSSKGVYNGLLINPAAYTHTSIALRDALQAIDLPCVEVHLSNPAARESFRHHSYITAVSVGHISGFGAKSYLLALEGLIDYIRIRDAGVVE
ncbi:MAG: type II 3-dehydroquinate dehydratase [Kiritimatiellae bacterium]|nr:type II 3-dehydroquinate dehydratase [Kiritimatiellia bacterium]